MPHKKVIITNPVYDEETKYLNMWITEAADYIDSLGNVRAVRLNGIDANPTKLFESITAHDPSLVMFNGHGNPTTIVGHGNVPLISSEHSTNNQFSGRIVHAVVCSAAHELGQKLVDLGARAFVGYKDYFYFWQQGDDTSDPQAKLFLEPALHVSKKLCEGETVQSAFLASQKMYAKNLKAELSANGSSQISFALEQNIRNHVWLGESEATI